jgi:Tol biopolymer transport system component
VAIEAERAHYALVPLLRFAPRERTEIVLSDDVDQANGSATPVPYDTVRLYAVPPESLSELNDYRDWVASLLWHEYTHILHLDDVGGFPEGVNHVFGKILVPNGFVPSWMIEGVAVLHEGDGDGSSGRNGSSLFEMWARALTVEGDGLPRLDQVSNPYLEWPRGAIPYLLGGRFMAFIERTCGKDALAGYLQAQGRQLWPYAPSWVGEPFFGGRSFRELWEAFRAEERARAEARLAQIRARPVTSIRPLTSLGARIDTPRWTPDGSAIVFHHQSLDEKPGLWRVARAGQDLGRAVTVDVNGTFALRSSREAVAAIGEVWHEYRVYDDLYLVDLDRGDKRRLTDGERATDPDLAPDGRTVVYVARSGPGRLALRRRAVEGGPATTLFERDGAQVFHPRVSPDGTRIAFELHEGGRRDIAIWEDGKVMRVTDDDALDLTPTWTPDGKWLLFASDRGGVYDLYAWAPTADPTSNPTATATSATTADPTPTSTAPDTIPPLPGTIRQVTNVETGALEPAVSPDGTTIAFVTYSRRGYDLATIPFEPETWLDPTPAPPAPAPAPRPAYAPLPTRPYRALDTLGPTFWLPIWSTDAEGTILGAITGGGDVVGLHAWSLQAWWSIGARQPGYAASYLGGWSWPRLDLSSSRSVEVSEGRPWRYESVWTPLDAGLNFTFTSVERALVLRVGWSGTIYDSLPPLPPPGPPLPPDVEFRDGLLSQASLGAVYSDARRFARSISPEEGRTIGLGFRIAASEIGSDYALARLRGSWSEYLRVPFTRHVVLAARLSGGVARGTIGGRAPYSIGGVAQQDATSILQSALLGGAPSAGADQLRGYRPDTALGNAYALANLELRFPLGAPELGFSTLPAFLRRLHGAVFLDGGDAFSRSDVPFSSEPFRWDRVRFGAGAELRLEAFLAYYIPLEVRLGFARGVGRLLAYRTGRSVADPDAEPHQIYLVVGQAF